MDAKESCWRLTRHHVRDYRTPIAALRHKALVSQMLHQFGPGARDAVGTPASALRLAREAVAGHRGQNEIEVVLRLPAAHELLELRERHALGLISDSLPVGPPCRRKASAEVDECLFRNVDAEGADCEMGRYGGLLF